MRHKVSRTHFPISRIPLFVTKIVLTDGEDANEKFAARRCFD